MFLRARFSSVISVLCVFRGLLPWLSTSSDSRTKCLHVFLRDGPHLHLRVSHDVSSFALCQDRTIAHTHQFISEMHQRLAHVLQLCSHHHFIVVPCRGLVPAPRVHHRDEAAIVLLYA